MKRQIVVWLAAGAVVFSFGSARAGTVCGYTQDSNGQAAKGVHVLAKHPDGKIIGQATSGANGYYQIDGVDNGVVNLFLEPGPTSFKPGSGVLTLDTSNGDVNWRLSDAAAAEATGNGPCPDPPAGLTTGETASIAVLGVGGAAAIAGTAFGLSQGGDSNEGGSKPMTVER